MVVVVTVGHQVMVVVEDTQTGKMSHQHLVEDTVDLVVDIKMKKMIYQLEEIPGIGMKGES